MLAVTIVYLVEHDVLHSLVLPVSQDLPTVLLAQDAHNKMYLKAGEPTQTLSKGLFLSIKFLYSFIKVSFNGSSEKFTFIKV